MNTSRTIAKRIQSDLLYLFDERASRWDNANWEKTKVHSRIDSRKRGHVITITLQRTQPTDVRDLRRYLFEAAQENRTKFYPGLNIAGWEISYLCEVIHGESIGDFAKVKIQIWQ